MTRQTRLAALALLGVLVSVASVGSSDPYRARSEAESAPTATPISAPAQSSDSGASQTTNDPYRSTAPYTENAPNAQTAPQSIAPARSAVVMSPVVPDAPGQRQTAQIVP